MARILIIGKYYYPFRGGIEQNTQNIAEYAAKHHNVTVLVNNHAPGSNHEQIAGVNVMRRHVNITFKGQPVSLSFFKGLNLADYDLIQFHSPNPYVNALFLLKYILLTKRPPIVITHHMDIYGRKFLRAVSMPFLHALVRVAAATIVTSAKNLALSRDLPSNGRYAIVPLSLAPENYTIDGILRSEATAWRRALCGDAPVVGFVGRHARYKGLDILVDAIAKMPGVHAIIAGEGKYGDNARNRAASHGISDRVHFIGAVSHKDKLKLYAGIDIFVFPSTEVTEAFGISQMEAMLCECPVVASDLPTGVTDVAIDDKTALLCRPSDVDSLIFQLNRLLSNPVLARRLAVAGRKHIIENMTQQIVAEKTMAIFEEAMAMSLDKGFRSK